MEWPSSTYGLAGALALRRRVGQLKHLVAEWGSVELIHDAPAILPGLFTNKIKQCQAFYYRGP